jgi:hypothetical protein
MKSLLAISTVFGLVFTACMTGESAQSDNPDLATAAVSTPDPSTASTTDPLIQPNACQVTWHRCADPDHGGRATFCTNGDCGGDPTAQAQALCQADCGAGTQCNPGNLLQIAGC